MSVRPDDEQLALEKLLCDTEANAAAFADEMALADSPQRRHLDVDPEKVQQGLAKLVLTLIELLRQLLERQALHRIEAGSLSDDEIERMGQTFLALEERMEDLKKAFDLEGEELNLNLGPLGDLM